MDIRNTTELQVIKGNSFTVTKTPCRLVIEVMGQRLILCDAVNGTEWIAASIIQQLQPQNHAQA
jgi:hypothetical protein